MSTNRERIDNTIIKQPAVALERGLLPGFQGKYVVDQGWIAVVTEGGSYKETLQPGHHSLGRYKYNRDIKMTNVNTKLQTLAVVTNGEFKVQQSVAGQMPLVIDVDLSLSVEYQVSDPLRVAMEIERPVTALFDRVIQATRDAVAFLSINEVRTGGASIARTIQQNLQGMLLPKTIGIEVSGVFITEIQARDSGQDALAQTAYQNFQRLNEWQVESYMTQNSQVTWQWLLINRPEVAQMYIAQYGELAKSMIDKGMLNTAGFLTGPPGSSPTAAGSGAMPGLLGGMPGMPGAPGAAPQLPAPAAPTLLDRMKEERGMLGQMPGAKVELRGGVDRSNTPDGSYVMRLEVPRTSGGQLEIIFFCPPSYPKEKPSVDVLVNGQPTPFQSSALNGWRGVEYLVEVANDIRQRLG